MDADELFEKAMRLRKKAPVFGELDKGAWKALRRYSCLKATGEMYTDQDFEGQYISCRNGSYVIHRLNILKAVDSGDIWQVGNIGPVRLKKICEWLAATEGDK